MGKYNIFMLTVNTMPMKELPRVEADKIAEKLSGYISHAFDDKYEVGDWGAEATLNVIDGGASHFYFILPDTDTVGTTKTFIANTMKLGMSDDFETLSSEVQHVRVEDSIEEGKNIIHDIVDVLFSQTKNVH